MYVNPTPRAFPSKNWNQTKISKAIQNTLQDGQIRLKASSPIIEGDLVGITNGNVVPIRDGIIASGGAQNSAIGGVQTVQTTATGTSAQNTATGQNLLSNGGFVVGWINASGYPCFTIFNAAGQVMGALANVIQSATTSGTSVVNCLPLSGGGFVATFTNASGYPQFAIFNNAGVLQGSITTISAVAVGNYLPIYVTQLSNGNLAFYFVNASAYPQVAIYSSSGVSVMATTQLVNVGVSNQYTNPMVALQGGGFAVAFIGTTNYPNIAIYSNTGSVVLAATSLESTPISQIVITLLQNGNFVVGWTNQSNATHFGIYSPTGSVVTAAGSVSYVSASMNWIGLTALSNGNFVIAWRDVTNSRNIYSIYNPAGANQNNKFDTSYVAIGSYGNLIITPLNNGQFAISYSTSASATNFVIWKSDLSNASYNTSWATNAAGWYYGSLALQNGFAVLVSVTANNTAPTIYMLDTNYNTPNLIVGVQISAMTTPTIPHWTVSCALTNSYEVVAFTNNSGYPQFAIYNSNGVQLVAPTTIQAIACAYGNIAITALQNGNFVVGFSNASGQPQFAIFNNAGVLQGSITTIQAVAAINQEIALWTLPNGNFVAVFTNLAGQPQFAIFTSTGVIVGSVTTITTNSLMYGQVSVAPLSNGGFVVGMVSGQGFPQFTTYNASGVQQISLTTVQNVFTWNCNVAGLANGNIAVSFTGANNYPQYSVYNSSGVQITAPTVVQSQSDGYMNNNSDVGIVALNGGGFSLGFNNSSNYPQIADYDNNGILQGSITTIQNIGDGTSSANGIVDLSVTQDNALLVTFKNASNYPQFAKYLGANLAIVGVALQPASVGNYFNCQSIGAYGRPAAVELRQAIWTAGQVFDHTALGGIKGVIQNKSVVLKGW